MLPYALAFLVLVLLVLNFWLTSAGLSLSARQLGLQQERLRPNRHGLRARAPREAVPPVAKQTSAESGFWR
jgi:hypothetical protein